MISDVKVSFETFIEPSLPFQGEKAVDAHAARAQAPPYPIRQ